MERLQQLISSRQKNFVNAPSSTIKKVESSHKFTPQIRKFNEAKEVLITLIQKSDFLFQKWVKAMLQNFQPFKAIFGLIQKQFQLMYESSQKYRPSLLCLSEDVQQAIEDNDIICLKHTTNRSEILQLIIGLLIQYRIKNNQTGIILYTSLEVKSQYESFYLNYQPLNTIDIENDYRQQLLKQIPNLEIRYYEQRVIPTQNDLNDLVIFDLFSSSRSLYGPQLDLVMTKKFFKKAVIYTDNENQMFYDELIEVSAKFPCEVVSINMLKDQLLKIIEDSKLYASRTDIVILSPTPEKQKAYLQDLLKNTKYTINIISGIQPYDNNLNNIFIASNEKQLASWRYKYYNVIAVFDYGMYTSVHFNVQQTIYVETFEHINQKQMGSRISILGATKPGKYFQMFNQRPKQVKSYQKQDLSLYVLSMLSLGYKIQDIFKDKTEVVKVELEKVLQSLKKLQIINITGTIGQVLEKNIHTYNISPFFAKIFLQLKGKWSQANILAYFVSALLTPGHLKKSINRNANILWKKSNDLASFVQILYVLELESQKIKKGQQKQIPVHKSSFTQEQLTTFGNLFHQYQPKPKLPISQMSLPALLSQLDIEQYFLKKCLDTVKKIRNSFKLKFIEYQNINDEIPQVLEKLLVKMDNVAIYTGSRRFGYKMNSGKNYLTSKQNLLSIFNERPNLILPFKLIKRSGKQTEILLSSKISEQDYLGIIGDIPVCSQKSSFSDTQVQFTGVSNAMFQQLWNSSFIEQFQKKYNCLVQPNKQIASIIIFCSKQTRQIIYKQFNEFLQKTKNKLEVETKINDYNVWKIVFEKGGSIRQLLNKNDSRVIDLTNIPIETTQQEVRQLLQQYADLEKVEVQDDLVTNTKVAHITFYTTGDLRWAVDQLDYTLFNMKKIKFVKTVNAEKNKMMIAESHIKFKWFAWPLTKKGAGIVVFKSKESTQKAAQAFEHQFDGKKVCAKVNQTKLELKGLNEKTDQIYLRSRLQVFGQIEDVQLQKVLTQQINNFENTIEYLIKAAKVDERFQIVYLNKMSNGLRVAKIKMYDPKSIPVLCNQLNQRTQLLGKTRLYVQPQHTHPIVVADRNLQKLYHDVLNDSLKEYKIDMNSFSIRTQQIQNRLYITLRSTNLDRLNLVINRLNQKLEQTSIELSNNCKEIFFSEMGKQLLKRLQQQQECKFVVKHNKKQMGVICKPGNYQNIVSELLRLSETVISDLVTCSVKTYKHLCNNLQKLKEIKTNNFLEEIKIDHIGKSIFIKGLPYHLKNARQTLLYYLDSIHTQNNDGMGQCCGICCQVLSRPYRLQVCGHAFCEECLMFSINNAFGDATCFPIKCPHCLSQVAIHDLNILLDVDGWAKLTNISVNDFINKHGDQYAFCFSPNCKGIYLTPQPSFDCQVCRKSYCSLCKIDKHDGMTCQQAKDGTVFLLKKYMEENDVRICPNTSCKMLMQRIDGCYRVTCSRCNQSICWKCPRDNMLIFMTADQCYKHLTDKHGGFW